MKIKNVTPSHLMIGLDGKQQPEFMAAEKKTVPFKILNGSSSMCLFLLLSLNSFIWNYRLFYRHKCSHCVRQRINEMPIITHSIYARQTNCIIIVMKMLHLFTLQFFIEMPFHWNTVASINHKCFEFRVQYFKHGDFHLT